MGEDVVAQMRARADAIAENDAVVIEFGGRPNTRWTYANERALRAGAAEIERLRAEVDRLKGGVDFDCFLNVDACPDGCLYDANGERVWSGGGVLFARREEDADGR